MRGKGSMTRTARIANPGLSATLKPLLRAYSLGYASTAGPKILGVILALFQGRSSWATSLAKGALALRNAAGPQRFPAFCAVLVGGSKVLEEPLYTILLSLLGAARSGTCQSASSGRKVGLQQQSASHHSIRIVSRLASSAISAFLAFELLNSGGRRSSAAVLGHSKFASSSTEEASDKDVEKGEHNDGGNPSNEKADTMMFPPTLMYSYTVPLTLFLLPHAIHTLLHIPISLRSTTTPLPLSTRLPRPLTHSTYPTFFIFSSAILMHAWMYTPSLLPRSYASWISSAAHLHPSILSVLRSARMGRWLYASDLPLPDSSVLSPLASRLALPPTWADPANLDRSPTDPRGFGTTNGGVPGSDRWERGIPCCLVHGSAGRVRPVRSDGAPIHTLRDVPFLVRSCEAHGVRRFIAGWSFAMRMYFPLQLVMGSRRLYQSRALLLKRRALRQKVRVVLGMVVRAAMGAARSSVFLGAFIAGFYYTVCLARTRVGPRVFSKHGVLVKVLARLPVAMRQTVNAVLQVIVGRSFVASKEGMEASLVRVDGVAEGEEAWGMASGRQDIVSPQMWDAGMAITAGCLACGWSIWLERKERRGELALWVWPRAGVCLTGRVYEKKDQWRERLAFVSSAAIVLAAAQEPENLLKGVFGKLLRGIYA